MTTQQSSDNGEECFTLNIDHLVLEDDTPVDLLSSKQQRLLVEPLYSSKPLPAPFLVTANVGLFYKLRGEPLVPDIMLSLGVQRPKDMTQKQNRAYLTWEFGKLPEVCIELVSDQEGDELTLSQESQQGKTTAKKDLYAQLHIPYYVVFDPLQQIQSQHDMNGALLRVWSMSAAHYTELTPPEGISTVGQSLWLADIGLGLTLWEGQFEDSVTRLWLRWCDEAGQVIPTGAEDRDLERQRADAEKARADAEKARADQAQQQAQQETQRSARLIEQLRALGVDPDTLL